MKQVWIEIDTFEKHFITDAMEAGVDAFFCRDAAIAEKIRGLSRIDVFDPAKLPDSIKYFTINSKADEEEAGRTPASTTLVIETGDWKIIPFENLIAQRNNLFAAVSTEADAIEAAGILEKGVDGIYIKGCSNENALAILKKIKQQRGSIALSEGKITSIEKLSTGDRVCIDTISNMVEGEGMLIGDYSNGMVLVNSESLDNPYVASRPFRVNAGAVHCYVMVPENRTRYLADLRSGDPIMIVNQKGETTTSVIGRIKQEKRPMLRIVIQGAEKEFSAVLQNAETIRVVQPGGSTKSVVSLQPGDPVVIFEEQGGRHFGFKIEETIEEK